jgi:hypothetical protein
MDDKSTPIESLNNRDDSQVVNQILSKYNDIQDGSIPPLNNNIPQMEKKFENRNLNNEIYDLNSKNVQFQDHYNKEISRTSKYNTQQNNPQYEDEQEYEDDQEYDEYEIVELPLWKRIINEVRIPLFILLIVVLFSNCYFDKFLLAKIPILGNQFNECNTYGFVFKAFFISLISYLLIKFVRF